MHQSYSPQRREPKPRDFARMKDLIREAIIVALRMEGVSETVIDRYMADAGEIEFSKTANRSMVAKLNHTIYELRITQKCLDKSSLIQRYISIPMGRYSQTSPGEDEYFVPIDRMLECLEIYLDEDENGICQSVLDVELYQLKIKIEIEGFEGSWCRRPSPSGIYTILSRQSSIGRTITCTCLKSEGGGRR